MLRKAVPSDIPSILALVAANPETLLPRTEDEYRELIGTTWVFECDGRVVGSCVLEVYSPKIAELRSLAVLEEFRDRGVGAELVQAAVAEGQRLNIREILVVTSSPEYFNRLGFGDCLHEKYALFFTGKRNT